MVNFILYISTSLSLTSNVTSHLSHAASERFYLSFINLFVAPPQMVWQCTVTVQCEKSNTCTIEKLKGGANTFHPLCPFQFSTNSRRSCSSYYTLKVYV
jgi:hypothetical protein